MGAFLTRVSSVRDCIFSLICDIKYNSAFEVNRKFLCNNSIIDSENKDSTNDIANIAEKLRTERNERIRQGIKEICMIIYFL